MTTDQFARPENGPAGDPDRPGKRQLVGALVIVKLLGYEPSYRNPNGKYDPQPMAEFDLVVVDGPHAGYTEKARREFGNLGKQIGTALEFGQQGVGRYVFGDPWYGIDWAEADADYEAASKALTGGEDLPF